MTATTDLDFDFRFIRGRQPIGLFAKRGRATWEALFLDGEPLSYDAIADASVRGKRLILSLAPNCRISPNMSKMLIDDSVLALSVSKTPVYAVERRIDHARSARVLKRRKQQLAAEGKVELFRSMHCPSCESSIDLFEMPASPYIYCEYCESVFTLKNQLVTAGACYRTCDQCGAFGRIRNYMEFYFYFLIVFYRVVYKDRYLCDGCAGRLAGKMLFRNLLFVVGIPAAFIVKVKSMLGREQKMQQLAKANRLAAAGKAREASVVYQGLYAGYPDHPGLLLNEGMGYVRAKEQRQAGACFERALKACPNYLPALAAARQTGRR